MLRINHILRPLRTLAQCVLIERIMDLREAQEKPSRERNGAHVAMRGRVLVVEDEEAARDALRELLSAEGYEVSAAAHGQEALSRLDDFDADVVLTDLRMPVLDGVSLIARGKERAPHASFLVMSASGANETEKALRAGAESYVTKPLDLGTVSLLVERAVARASLSREASLLRTRMKERVEVRSVVARHPSMQRLMKLLLDVAQSTANVLFTGERGTGKSLLAEVLHEESPRRRRPLVQVACDAHATLESELFGGPDAAFHAGKVVQAAGGTLLLDEVDAMPLRTQSALAALLARREVDVRVVAASTRDIRALTRAGAFDEQLFSALGFVELEVPPLRQRRSDIPHLVEHLLSSQQGPGEHLTLQEDAHRLLLAYPWPGNVRELSAVLRAASARAGGLTLSAGDFPALQAGGADDTSLLVPGATLAELERMAIVRTLESVDGSTAKAADLLGISRRKIQYRLKEWGLTGAFHDDGVTH